MFKKAASEKDYYNEGIKYRIVDSYEKAYRYNSQNGQGVPKAEQFVDINESNYKSQNRKREIQMMHMEDNYDDYDGEEKSIWSKIWYFIELIIEIIT